MRRKKITIIGISAGIVLAALLCLASSALMILRWGSYDSFSEKFGLLLAVLSTVISVVALVYAMITYYSIDRVQAMNAMEGNVLCNPDYSVAYPENIQQFEDCRTEDAFGERLFAILFYPKPANCQEFAQDIQRVVENLTWIAWVRHDEAFDRRCEELLQKLRVDQRRFGDVNSGLKLLIEENIKLIDSAIHYQNHNIAHSTALCPMENIRGRVLVNPLARLTFHNYLGLEYMKRARDLIGIKNLLSADDLRTVRQRFADGSFDELRGYYAALLDVAIRSFAAAKELAADDLAWNGYVHYHFARAKMMQYLLDPAAVGSGEMEAMLREVLEKRENVLYIIWKNDHSDPSYLHRQFLHEADIARQLIDSFKGL